ncbi:hypothetical protein ASG43_10940 [Aureimonas sp. Leaf454]|uniref:hypothetical protein n=1 Tax=Aureimonas sp. Leaf454 TaxID=1736381 RepID=UPI0006FBD668|nr:hypothetical protein [Aureimonas sp. Leaf454]KQT47585.1 hypothetical protein ASG43_10940 [Aureimonas sp. Leaf454]
MKPVRRRLVLHFPGFEALDAEAHRRRYERSARQSGPVYGLDIEVGALRTDGAPPFFDVVGRSDGAQTESRILVFAYDDLITRALRGSTLSRLLRGYGSAIGVVAEGGLGGYIRHGWRFALFFAYPFLLATLAILLCLALAALPMALGGSPWHGLWSAPLAAAVFQGILVPVSRRYHILHLFADWELAVAIARGRDPALVAWQAAARDALRRALAGDHDEIVVTSHSMGSSMAVLVLGGLLEADPAALAGRRVTFLTLGGAVLQSALLRSAHRLRGHVGRLAEAREVDWIEIQCLTDAVNFYRSRVVAAAGHRTSPAARIVLIRMKRMLTPEHYRRIRRDALRVHRQYVLGSDRRSSFDFSVLTAGPTPASDFVLQGDENDAAAASAGI